jgi:prevent-host-death family protein
MKTIGIRELRQRASEFIEAVKQGETLEVTAHGRPVARLVPARGADRRSVLGAGGRLRPGQGDLLDLGAPLPPAAPMVLPSVRLARARARER